MPQIKFEIYKNGQRVTQFEPISAMAVGPESAPIPGEVQFKDGFLVPYKAVSVPLRFMEALL